MEMESPVPSENKKVGGVSFGVVATFEYDASSHDISPKKSFSKRASVEDFEKFRQSQKIQQQSRRQKRHAVVPQQQTASFVSEVEDRSQRLQELRERIEATIDAADSVMRGDADGSDLTHLLMPSKMTHGGKLICTSFPPPPVSAMMRPATRSMSRISSMHLSRLDLGTPSKQQPQVEINGDGMKNAVFTFGVTSNTSTDAAPKRPKRKCSKENLLKAKFLSKAFSPAPDIGMKNASWSLPKPPTRKRSNDCLVEANLEKQIGGTSSSLSSEEERSKTNAAWDSISLSRATKRRSKESLSLKSTDAPENLALKNTPLTLPKQPVRTSSKERIGDLLFHHGTWKV